LPTWGEELQELGELVREAQGRASEEGPPSPGNPSPHDILRRTHLKALSQKTERATIVYATAWLEEREGLSADVLSIGLGDKHGFMEAVSNIQERELDLFLHSPGGSPEAAEAIIEYLRTRFDHIRAIVPLAAMSAATMMALACDEIVMGAHSQLGPIDPQLTIHTPEGPRSAPGQAIIDQFALAKKECQDPTNIGAWLPILRSYGPGLIAICDHQRALAEDFAARSLEQHMFAGEADGAQKAKAAAAWFADFAAFRSHSRRVSRDDAREQGLKVLDLEQDDDLQDAILSVHHAVQHTLSGTQAGKIIENHHGRAWIRQAGVIQMIQAPAQMPGPQGQPPMLAPQPVPPQTNRPPPPPNRRGKRRGR